MLVRSLFARDLLVVHLWIVVGTCAMLLVRNGSLLARWCFAVGVMLIIYASLLLSWFMTDIMQIPSGFTCCSLDVRCWFVVGSWVVHSWFKAGSCMVR